jgi:hypothetical protein
MNSFGKGVLIGAAVMLGLCLLVVAAFDGADHNRDAQLLQEEKDEAEQMLEEYSTRDPYEFLEVPGVRGAADGARDEYYRRIGEILQRYGGDGNH